MRKNWRTVLSALLSLCCLFTLIPFGANSEGVKGEEENLEQVEVWRRTDIILNSAKTYENPFLDVQIDAVFTHTDGTQIKLFGFWNGGDEWRIRFSPTKAGVWRYRVTCTDTSDAGLHNAQGAVLAVENTRDTELDRHGFVRISDNGRYFVYDDGTPFYWLGDTNWQAPNYVSTTQCNYPGCTCGNQFKHEVDNRLDKGFTVYQTYFDSGENDGGGQLATTSEPSLWLAKYSRVNPDTFTEKIDGMFDYLADRGMVIALGYGVHFHTTNGMGQEAVERISRYLTARYASYPVVWITAQEITGDPQFNIWKRSAEIVDAGDGYDHPQGTHMFPADASNPYVQDLDQQPWHEWWALQSGHGPAIRDKAFYQSYWDNGKSGKVKPYLETEANYEDITCGGFNGYDASRISAWKSNLLGSYGFTYGVTGIWANNYSTAGNMGWYGSFSFEPWYMGLDKPGSYEMTYLRRFFEYADFSSLVPRFNDDAYSDCLSENKLVSSSEDGKTYVAYFYNTSLTTGELRGLKRGTYSARWYNPLTGKFIDISKDIQAEDGVYKIPPKPTSGDWALLVTSRDLGAYETEEAYTDPLINQRENLALGAAATASSDNGAAYAAGKATDGEASTYWCAANGSMPQWLQIDMKEVKDFKEVYIYMHQGNTTRTEKLSYTLKGSLDGQSWDTLYTGKDVAPISAQGKDVLRVRKSGSYRYLRVEYTDITTNWAAVYEFAVYADGEEEPEPEPENVNLALGAAATASSSTDFLPYRAVDGDASTYWCASSGDMPQWLKLDMGKPQSFNRVHIIMYGGTVSVSYTLEGSDDGENWDIVQTAQNQALSEIPGPTAGSVSAALDIEAKGEYRYLRMNFTDVQGNWATVVEFELFGDTGESDPDDELPVYEGVVQKPEVSSPGTGVYTESGDFSDSAACLFDGDPNTLWSPYAPIASQTILMDLLQENVLRGIAITLGENAVLPPYRIEGSLNGTDWTILADATLREGQSYHKSGRTVICEALAGKYRYVKLLWLNTGGNGAIKTIADIALYADLDTPAHEAKPDISSLQKSYDAWKNQHNSRKTYTKESWETLQTELSAVGYLLAHPALQTEKTVKEALGELDKAAGALVKTAENRAELQKLLDEAAAVDPTGYTEESLSALSQAVSAAKAVQGNGYALQKQIDEAAKALGAAIEGLEKKTEPAADKAALEKLLGEAAKIDPEAYTAESAAEFHKALQAAERVYADEGADQKQIDEAAKTLGAAIEGLEEKIEPAADKTALEKLLGEAAKIDPEAYTAESAAEFHKALQVAERVYADEGADQKQIDEAAKALGAAIEGLEDKIESAAADKTALEKLLGEAAKIDPEAYTAESVIALEKALVKAKTIFAAETAGQGQIDEAVEELKAALKGLPVPSSGDGSGPDEISQPKQEEASAVFKGEGAGQTTGNPKTGDSCPDAPAAAGLCLGAAGIVTVGAVFGVRKRRSVAR